MIKLSSSSTLCSHVQLIIPPHRSDRLSLCTHLLLLRSCYVFVIESLCFLLPFAGQRGGGGQLVAHSAVLSSPLSPPVPLPFPAPPLLPSPAPAAGRRQHSSVMGGTTHHHRPRRALFSSKGRPFPSDEENRQKEEARSGQSNSQPAAAAVAAAPEPTLQAVRVAHSAFKRTHAVSRCLLLLICPLTSLSLHC